MKMFIVFIFKTTGIQKICAAIKLYFLLLESLKKLNWIKKKRKLLNLQKLPEVPDRKKGWGMRKEKTTSRRGEQALSLPGCDRRFDIFIADGCLGATHMSLD